MAEEIATMEQAFEAARLELDPTASADDDITSPALEEAPPIEADQSEASDPELQAIFDSVEDPAVPDTSIDTESPDFWNTPVDLGEGVSVPLSELRSGYMMQADYTRKTQAVAERAKTLEAADQFYQSFVADPQEFARAIAVDQGWLTDDNRTPVKEIPGATQLSEEEREQQINTLVEERIESDPRMATARQVEARATIDGKFTEIEERLGVSIPNTARGEIVLEARRRNVYDLDLITEHWMNNQRDKHRSGAQLKQGASARPQTAAGSTNEEETETVSTFQDAVLAARAELNAGA